MYGGGAEMADEYWNAMVPELTVRDIAVSLTFYRLLGFTVRFQRSEPDFVYLTRGQAQLMLEAWHVDGWQTAPLAPPFGRGINLQIEVTDVGAMVAVCQQHGIALFRPLTERWYATQPGITEGQREFLVQDPDGYLLRFQEYLGQRPTTLDIPSA